MINFIVTFDFDDNYGIILNFNHKYNEVILLNPKGKIVKYNRDRITILSMVEQIQVYNDYFYKFMNIPEHLQINKLKKKKINKNANTK